MAREKHPYTHEDISVLAKSLKQQLAGLGHPPGHVELLNALAVAAGAQNYQSWLAAQGAPALSEGQTAASKHRPAPSEPPGEPALLRISRDGNAREIFDRNSDGEWLDRRRGPVARILALIDVDLLIEGYPTGTLRLRSSVRSDLLPPSEDPQVWFKQYLPRALTDLLARAPERVRIFGTVDVPLDTAVTEESRSMFEEHVIEVPVRITPEHHARLAQECQQAARCAEDFERVKDLLWELFGIASPAAATEGRRAEMAQIAKYLRDYLSAEGDMFMGSWNQEKIGGAARLLERAAKNPRSVSKHEWQWARRNIFTASPPNHWDSSVTLPAGLLERTSGPNRALEERFEAR